MENECLVSARYGLLQMYGQAVEAALDLGDVALAKAQAAKEADPALRKLLWLRILDRSAAADSGNVARA